jgi:hypothetical protein
MLTAGIYPQGSTPHFWELRQGTFDFPIIIRAADGPGTATLPSMDVFGCRYMYLIGLKLEAQGGDVLHFAGCDHILVRQTQVVGLGDVNAQQSPQEALKANQTQYLYVEDSDISGGWDNALDFVAVQNGHIARNRIHRAGDWCMYVKGGSAHLLIDSNEIYDGRTGGFTAGQGTGFQWMVSPWLHYEAYDIKFVNNIIHDTEGAGMGVNGGFNVLLAYNTLFRIGRRSHVLEFVFGSRSCDGRPGDEGRERCGQYLAAGGWGTTIIDDGDNYVRIPNKNVFVYNNIVYNPPGYQSEWQHFTIFGPYSGPWQQGSNAPSPALADQNLQVRGNILWNGGLEHPLGIEDSDQGCQGSNVACNQSQLRADNAINTLQPQLVDPSAGNFRPVPGGNVFGAITYTVPDFDWSGLPARPQVPRGNLSNSVGKDRDGNSRTSPGPPGAYTGSAGPERTFTVSGRVSAPDGSGIAGVRLTFPVVSGPAAAPPAVETDTAGSWHQSGFQRGAVYLVTPAKAAYTFSPPSHQFESSDSNLSFTGVAAGPLITRAWIKGKNLIVVGERFSPGAVILIDGVEQRTTNDRSHPSTKLIGKGSGRKISPGQTVRLRVRNPGGAISDEFVFSPPN